MEIGNLCAETERIVWKEGRDLWGHIYEPAEIHFEFQFGEYVLAAADAAFRLLVPAQDLTQFSLWRIMLMARSAARIRSLQTACDLAHDRAFNPNKYRLPPLPAHPAPHVSQKSRREWLEEHFELAVRKEFERVGLR